MYIRVKQCHCSYKLCYILQVRNVRVLLHTWTNQIRFKVFAKQMPYENLIIHLIIHLLCYFAEKHYGQYMWNSTSYTVSIGNSTVYCAINAKYHCKLCYHILIV